MRASLPVVVSSVGGAPEAVVDGRTGFLVDRGNVEQLREKLTLLIRDADRRVEMGKAGRQRFERQYTFEKMFDQTMGVYRSAIEGGRNP